MLLLRRKSLFSRVVTGEFAPIAESAARAIGVRGSPVRFLMYTGFIATSTVIATMLLARLLLKSTSQVPTETLRQVQIVSGKKGARASAKDSSSLPLDSTGSVGADNAPSSLS